MEHPVNITCADPGHAGRSAQPGWVTILGTTTSDVAPVQYCAACSAAPAGAYQTAKAAGRVADVAQSTQDGLLDQIVTSAQAIVDELTTTATTYAAAKTTLQSAVAGLPASPTVAQISTFIKGPLATYLLADNAAGVTLGSDLIKTAKGLGNTAARLRGSSSTF